jgi:preprotein translocase subunit SecA
MKLFGGDTISGLMTRFNMPEDVPLQHPLVSRAIEQAQVKVEGFNFDSRKHLVEYDDVLNKQREIIYQLRRKVLETAAKGDNVLKEEVVERVHKATASLVELAQAQSLEGQGSANETIVSNFSTIIPFDENSQKQLLMQLEQLHTNDEKTEFLSKLSDDLYNKREQQIGENLMRQIEKSILLGIIDNLWMNHLDAIDNLRQGIGLRGYAQRDPLVEYKNEAFRMFEQLMWAIDDEVVHRIYKIQIQPAEGEPQQVSQQPHVHTHLVTNTPQGEVSEDNKKKVSSISTSNDSSKHKLSRNDPCWCGSGKKWKKCHYPQTS